MIKKIILLYVCATFYVNSSTAQNLSTDLERKIFNLNNDFKYEESQKILLNILNTSEQTNKKFEACILLSNTYKRVFDYTSTQKYLDEALLYTITPKQKNRIYSLKAMVLFDTNNYRASKKIMLMLETSSFNGLAKQEIEILLMQMGYVFYLDKKYSKSKEYYQKSLEKMNLEPVSCNQPIVYGKIFGLFKETQEFKKIEPLYKKGMLRAQQCNILKYRLYLMQEYLKVIDDTDYKKKSTIQSKIDSIEALYAPVKKTSELLNSKEKIITQNLKEEKKKTLKYYILGIGILVTLSSLGLFLFNSKNRRLKKENEKIKNELSAFFEKKNSSKTQLEKFYAENKLTKRQKQVLDLTLEGLTNKEISEQLYISENTVKFHLKNVYKILKQQEIKIERNKLS